jgi:hypothetical protein
VVVVLPPTTMQMWAAQPVFLVKLPALRAATPAVAPALPLGPALLVQMGLQLAQALPVALLQVVAVLLEDLQVAALQVAVVQVVLVVQAVVCECTGDPKYLRSSPLFQLQHIPAVYQGKMGRGFHSACQHAHFMVKAVQLIKPDRLAVVHTI